MALEAVAVSVLEPPALIEAGLADRVTVVFSTGGVVVEPPPPQPAKPARTGNSMTKANLEKRQRKDSPA